MNDDNQTKDPGAVSTDGQDAGTKQQPEVPQNGPDAGKREEIGTAEKESGAGDPVDNIIPNQAFVVLCEREDINQDCVAVLLKYGVRPVYLNDVNEQRSLLELLAQHQRVKFALIILSGDDFVYDRLIGKPGVASLTAKSNVVFHLGYLLAKFGNLGIMALYQEQKSFRLPTGLQNAAFVPYKKGGMWEQILESKLKTQKII